MKEKEPIRLRQKEIANGNKSLYLDIYMRGIRRYEFLRLYLIPERTKEDRERNKETIRLANAIKAQRIIDLQSGRWGFDDKTNPSKVRFFDFMREQVERRKRGNGRNGNYLNWQGCVNLIAKYEKRNITIAEVTKQWLEGFIRFMDKYTSERTGEPLKQNTRVSYWRKVRCCMSEAQKQGIIRTNPCLRCDVMREEDSERNYLTLDEVRRLAQKPMHPDSLKRAFLFSCLTGLRKSDVQRLTWGDIHEDSEGTQIIFRQKKTHGMEYLHISQQARKLMGERQDNPQKVFKVSDSWHNNVLIDRWVRSAGIDKHITFHCARHTFATMMLTIGTDIYTTSKLLGHKNVKTTQIYARIIDEKKKNAVDNIPDILSDK